MRAVRPTKDVTGMNGAYSRGDHICVQRTKTSSFTFPMTKRRSRRLICAASCLLAALGSPAFAQRPDAQASFRRGLSALHQFEYEEANDAFREARQNDPAFAM